jgi:glucose dehydrogenase
MNARLRKSTYSQEAPQNESVESPAVTESETAPEVTAFAAVTTERIIETSPAQEWLSYGGGYDEQRHSALTSVNRETVNKLGVAWTYDLKTNRGVESTPIVVDGVMYVTSAWSLVYALDALTGKELWVYDPAGGDNLFLSSIVAVDANTGRYRWHFQTTPGDSWDYTATQSIILADLPLGEGGAPLRVAMQAPKNGFFYVINAASGEFISGNAFVPVNWATGLDLNGRPIEAEGARYEKNPISKDQSICSVYPRTQFQINRAVFIASRHGITLGLLLREHLNVK